MMKALIVLSVCIAGSLAFPELPKNASNIWALLVAGSNGYYNYRHQADVCHAYHVLNSHGVPDDHIVVMMYDDIANNDENPDKGTIINKPGGPDVYKGVPKDYTKGDVTPDNFLKIMQGQKVGTGSGKVINSGPNDYVFINLVDHGAVGIFGFPTSLLYRKALTEALDAMHTNKRYKQLVFYMEACEAGSMFEDVPEDTNIYVTTATNAKESSQACYYDNHLATYLGDVYSIKWMENVDQVGTAESLEKQFEIVKRETTTSPVQQYGDLSWDNELISTFFGGQSASPQQPGKGCPDPDSVPTFDVPIAILSKRISAAKDYSEKKKLEMKLNKELETRITVRSLFEKIAVATVGNELGATERALGTPMAATQHDCRETVYKYFFKKCPHVEYTLKHVHVLSNLCEMGAYTDQIMNAINIAC